MNKAPCKDCKERMIGCHASCEDYIKYRKERDAFLEERIAIKEERYREARHIQKCKRKCKR